MLAWLEAWRYPFFMASDLQRPKTAAEAHPILDRELLVSVAPSILKVVRQTMGASHPDVEDLVQESLHALVKAWPSFRGDCTPKHFACRIAVQRCVDAIRKQRVRQAHLRQAASEPPAPAPAETVPRSRLRNLWHQALSELPQSQAQALSQRYVLGYTLDEMASASGVPLNTVKSRLRLAKRVLREKISSDRELAELVEGES